MKDFPCFDEGPVSCAVSGAKIRVLTTIANTAHETSPLFMTASAGHPGTRQFFVPPSTVPFSLARAPLRAFAIA